MTTTWWKTDEVAVASPIPEESLASLLAADPPSTAYGPMAGTEPTSSAYTLTIFYHNSFPVLRNSVLYPLHHVDIVTFPEGAILFLQALPCCFCRKCYVTVAGSYVHFWEPEGWNCYEGVAILVSRWGKTAELWMTRRIIAYALEPIWL